jgi:CRP/FNR family transcriptional regulator, cyclic AMP receptor protein
MVGDIASALTRQGRSWVISFLDSLTPESLAELENLGHRRRWPRGGVVCSQDESSRWVAVLLRGHVKASLLTDEGEEIMLHVRGPGALIGELEATDGKPRPATVWALEPIEALVVPHDAFHSYLGIHEPAARVLTQMLCERVRDADHRHVEYSSFDAQGRLSRRIVELADAYGVRRGSAVHITLPLTQGELAAWIGVSLEAVAKALRTLRARGWVETGRRKVVVRDLEALRRSVR